MRELVIDENMKSISTENRHVLESTRKPRGKMQLWLGLMAKILFGSLALIPIFIVGCDMLSIEDMPTRPTIYEEGFWCPWFCVVPLLIVLLVILVPLAYWLGRRWLKVPVLRYLTMVFFVYVSYESVSGLCQYCVAVDAQIEQKKQNRASNKFERGNGYQK